MLDFFVKETYWIYKILEEHTWLFTTFYIITSLAAYCIFLYHENELRELDFFIENVEHFYDFNRTNYKFNKALHTVILPFAMFIILLSLIQQFDSRKFLKRYG